jgi:hypothetical protein
MPLVIAHRKIPRSLVGERVAVDRRAIPQPRLEPAHLMAIRLPAADGEGPPVDPLHVAGERRRAAVLSERSLLDAVKSGCCEAEISVLEAVNHPEHHS